MIILKTVNFGSRKSGLSTVGYTLLNADGTTKQARATTGVAEQGSTGIYHCDITFDDDWRGYILWDTGGTTPLYATEDFDYRKYSVASGYASVVVDNVWTKEDKEKLFNIIEDIRDELSSNKVLHENTLKRIEESAGNIIADIDKLKFKKEISDLNQKISLIEDQSKGMLEKYTELDIKENFAKIADALTVVMKNIRLMNITKEIDTYERIISG